VIRLRHLPCPLVGSHSSHTENTRIITSPSQKPGIAKPNRAMILPKLSQPVFSASPRSSIATRVAAAGTFGIVNSLTWTGR